MIIKQISIVFLLVVFLMGCATNPTANVDINVVDGHRKVNSLFIALDTQQLNDEFANALDENLTQLFTADNVRTVVEKGSADDVLLVRGTINNTPYSHAMLIHLARTIVTQGGATSALILNVTLVDTQTENIVMRANIRVEAGSSHRVEDMITNSSLSAMGETQAQLAVNALIEQMGASGLLG